MKGLVTLYISRGYPVDEVHKWLYSNLSKRWNERLDDRQSQPGTDVLVLKSQYNLAWNYFNATQLGDTIFGYWREWLQHADAGRHNLTYPPADPKDLRVSDWLGQHPGTWDLRETNLFNSRIVLSRKCTRNFLNISNLWKRSVLETIEEQTLGDILYNAATYATVKRPLLPDINTQVVGPRLKRPRVGSDHENDDEGDVWSSSSTPDSWRSAPMGTWGCGSRV